MIKILFYTGLFVSTTLSHPQGNANIDIHIFPDSLLMKLNLNKDDILYYSIKGNKDWREMTEEEVLETNRKLERYLKEWLIIEFDREKATEMRRIVWSSDPSDPAKDMDTSDFAKKNLDMTLSWPRPPHASEMRFSSQLYYSFPFEPVARVKVIWKGTLLKEEYLSLDDDLFIELHPDSLKAMAQRIIDASKPKKPVWMPIVIGISAAVFALVLTLAFIWRMRIKQGHPDSEG